MQRRKKAQEALGAAPLTTSPISIDCNSAGISLSHPSGFCVGFLSIGANWQVWGGQEYYLMTP